MTPAAKAPAADASGHRRSQPARQVRTNPSRSAASHGRAQGGRDALAGPTNDQPIDIFPASTHFADAMTALPKELVRHLTLLKEVDAKIYTPELELFQLVQETLDAPLSEPRPKAAANAAPANASDAEPAATGAANGQTQSQSSAVAADGRRSRRELYHRTYSKMQEMLVSLEEKNHVISTANEALSRQLARVDDVWPFLEAEYSEEAKWGSTTHWAYAENRVPKTTHAERTRRDAAATISAAAQAIADEAAARSDARKQAVQAKKNLKTQHQDSDMDELDRHKGETGKKSGGHGKVRKAPDSSSAAGAGATTNGNAPKRRKVDKTTNGGVPMEKALSGVFGSNAPKPKATSPRETPALEAGTKRKALPSSSSHSKKRNGAAGVPASATSSPVLGNFPDPKPPRASPAPSSAPRPASSRARQNSQQSNMENGKQRPSSSASNKPEVAPAAAPEVVRPPGPWPAVPTEAKPSKETATVAKGAEAPNKKDDAPATAPAPAPASNPSKKETKTTEVAKREPTPAQTVITTVTTKSGRASKPSTPALATFQEAQRARSARENATAAKRTQKKTTVAQVLAAQQADESGNSSMQDDEQDDDIDADEPTYCICGRVSYGEMVACDGKGCKGEWFHLECVGLKAAPKGQTLWYCDECKKNNPPKKVNGR